MEIPRSEHPKPQFQRSDWLNLNGVWTCEFDFGKSGLERGLPASHGFAREIVVPFCPESSLSGVAHTDFIEAMWYHREFSVPEDWRGRRVLLHFGAVDYEAEIFIDGRSAGVHYGGSSSFHLDITRLVEPGRAHHLVVRVSDELRSRGQPRGKQSSRYHSHGCCYTRVTGIWQTVWLEAVHALGIRSARIVPDFDAGRFHFSFSLFEEKRGARVKVSVLDGGALVAAAECAATAHARLACSPDDPKSWSPASPFLYDLIFEIFAPDGTPVDRVTSYAGLRKIHIEGDEVLLNNEPLFQRLVLDQGYYPDGIWTAPTDAALKRDIELAQAAGFMGARLHQKAFEERFHYWADRLGYLTWAEYPSWGCDVNRYEDGYNMLTEWRELVERDRNHPSIITWTPLNETRNYSNPALHKRFHEAVYDLTKALDPTRPVNDASGYIHIKTDLWTVHHYERGEKLREHLVAADTPDGIFHRWPDQECAYAGQPYLNDEFGGLKWIPPARRSPDDASWGYGNEIRSEEEFFAILAEEIEIMKSIPKIRGWCYTQLTDVEQEKNGIYTYDRTPKFDPERVRAIFSR